MIIWFLIICLFSGINSITIGAAIIGVGIVTGVAAEEGLGLDDVEAALVVDGDGDADGVGEGVLDGLLPAEEGEGLKDTELDGDTDELAESDTEEDGDTDAEGLMLGEEEGDSDIDEDVDELGDTLALGEGDVDRDMLAEADRD